MADDVVIQIKGLREQLVKFESFGITGKKRANKAIAASIFDIERVTKPITPIDTGKLRNSFRTQLRDMRGKLSNISSYGIYVHEGTRRWPLTTPPRNPHTVRRFMKEGAEKSVRTVEDNFKKALNAMVKELAVKVI